MGASAASLPSAAALCDVLVVGAGPAALSIAAALAQHQLGVILLAAQDPWQRWPNTYGIWGHELDELGLDFLLAHRWEHSSSVFLDERLHHGLDYGLIDNEALQNHWRQLCSQHGVSIQQDAAVAIHHHPDHTEVQGASGQCYRPRLVVDATGHQPVFVQRPQCSAVAQQGAYGVVGRFSKPPIQPGSFVLMDYRNHHLSPEQQQEPPTFLYAIDLGEGRYFVEETSLAACPPLPFPLLKHRLEQRLAWQGCTVEEVQEVEHCLFPMNLPLPDRRQRVVGFGGAATMVHPASGYMLGSLLRRGPGLAAAIAQGLRQGHTGAALSRAAWSTLWSDDLVRRHGIYRFGLEKLMRLGSNDLQAFFHTFFHLPQPLWSGFLTNTLPLASLTGAMVRLLATAPWTIRRHLLWPQGRELNLLLTGLLLR